MKKFLLIGGGLVALVVLLIVLKRSAGAQTTVVQQSAPPPAPPSFTPTSSTYSPIPLFHTPVGVTSGSDAGSLPPGVDPSQVVLPVVQHVAAPTPEAPTFQSTSACTTCDTVSAISTRILSSLNAAPAVSSPDMTGVTVRTQTDHGGTISKETYDPGRPTTAPPINSTEPISAPGQIAQTPLSGGNATLIDNDYMLLFGRHPDANGAAYWQNRLDTGLSTADLIGELTRGAQHVDAQAEADKNPILYNNYRGNAAPVEGGVYIPAMAHPGLTGDAPVVAANPLQIIPVQAPGSFPITAPAVMDPRDTGVGRHFL